MEYDSYRDFSLYEYWGVGSPDSTYFDTPPVDGGTWERHWYKEFPSNLLVQNGTIDGALGIRGDLSTATLSSPAWLLLLGNYLPGDSDYSMPSIFSTKSSEFDYTKGIAYSGYVGGLVSDDVLGGFHAVYATEAGDIGLLKGQFTGETYQDIDMWDAAGTVYPIAQEQKGDLTITSANLSENLDYGFMGGWVSGDFGSSGTEFSSDLGWGTTTSIAGNNDWGVFSLVFGSQNLSDYTGDTGTWSARAAGLGNFGNAGYSSDSGYWKMDFDGTLASDGTLTGSGSSGTLLTLTRLANMSGSLIGSKYSDYTWQAWASGYWEKVQDLYYNGIMDGDSRYIAKQYNGSGGTPGYGAYYNYGYDAVTNEGWSYYSDGSSVEEHKNYHSDGTIETWTDEDGALSSSTSVWTGSLLDLLKDEADTYAPYVVHNDPGYYLDENGWAGGNLGGLDDLWTATSADRSGIYLLGESDGGDGDFTPMIFSLDIKSYNPYDGSCTIMDPVYKSQNGAYSGYIGGRITGGSKLIDGDMLALFLDGSGNAGIIKGGLAGEIYDKEMGWEADGSVFPISLVSGTGYSAADLDYYLVSDDESYGEDMSGALPGTFDGGGEIIMESVVRESKKIGGVIGTTPWGLGINSITMGGTYSGGDDYWKFPFRALDYSGLRIREGAVLGTSAEAGTTGQWSGGMISGTGFGSWADLENVMTGVSGIELKGTFNTDEATWQASQMIVAVDTNTFLTLASTEAGRDKLAELDIPSIEIGSASLAGSGSFDSGTGTMNVSMSDVKFFAYSAGGNPLIWSTGSVGGNYTGSPLVDGSWVVPLISSGPSGYDLYADFVLRAWDGSKWGANIDNGVGEDGTFSFSGAAAGNISGSDFTGTAAGTVYPPAP
jgi:hypothetical protein